MTVLREVAREWGRRRFSLLLVALAVLCGSVESVLAQQKLVVLDGANAKNVAKEHTDLLRPEEEKLRRELYTLLNEMREKKVRPKVIVQTKKGHGTPWTLPGGLYFRYTIHLPKKYRALDKKHDHDNRLGRSYMVLIIQAIHTPIYSYYAFLTTLREDTGWGNSYPGINSPEEWKKHRDWYLGGYTPGTGVDRYWRRLDQHFRTREHLDPTGRTKLELLGGGFSIFFAVKNWYFPYYQERLEKRDRSKPVRSFRAITARTGDAVIEKDTKKRTALIKALPRDKTQQDALVSFFCSTESDNDLLLVARTIIEYFCAAPKSTPLYTDLTMALFVAAGYDFDRKTGKYTINKSGEQLLDYVIEHPKSNVMGYLTILYDHGCAEFMDKLIQKHHPKLKTWEKFREAYKPT